MAPSQATPLGLRGALLPLCAIAVAARAATIVNAVINRNITDLRVSSG